MIQQRTIGEPRETVTCLECGVTQGLCWFPDINAKLKARSLCHSCDHWTHYVETDPSNPDALVIEGAHYVVGDEAHGGGRMSGFYGQKFIIEKFSGERIVTTNLWCQGRIPERFRGRLPDNARFIEQKRKGICLR